MTTRTFISYLQPHEVGGPMDLRRERGEEEMDDGSVSFSLGTHLEVSIKHRDLAAVGERLAELGMSLIRLSAHLPDRMET